MAVPARRRAVSATPPTVLVTGATGKVGGETARLLHGSGAAVRVYVRDAARARRALGPVAADAVVGDFQDLDAMRRALRGVDRLLLVPPDEHVREASALLALAVEAGVRRVVRISALGAAADAESAILRAHAEGERALEATGLAHVHLRCNSFFQNVLWYTPWMERLDRFFACRGDVPVAWVDARDVAACAARVLLAERDPQPAYELTGPEPLTGHDMARSLSRATSRSIACTSLPPAEFEAQAVIHGWRPLVAREWAAMFGGSYYGTGRGGRVGGDVQALLRRPPRTFARFAEEHREMLASAA
jgi:uncharacterized protein YbjT (DUF2867 family)